MDMNITSIVIGAIATSAVGSTFAVAIALIRWFALRHVDTVRELALLDAKATAAHKRLDDMQRSKSVDDVVSRLYEDTK